MDWELHLDPPRSASFNMAKDAHCLARTRDSGRPALRLYGWAGPTLSVGRTQRPEREVDLAACQADGVPLVRRLTGGRAVLHGSDLTYAVTAPTSLPGFDGGVLAVYRSLSRVFVTLLEELGCQPEVHSYSGRERVQQASPICFSTPSAFEVLVAGRKLVGSAQRLLPTAFLQHGSLPLAPQYDRLARLFLGANAEDLRDRMTDLHTLGVLPRLSEEDLRERLVAAFAAVLGVRFVPAPWSAADEAAVRSLEADFPPLETEAPPNPVPTAHGASRKECGGT